ncbi:choice-of-anchor J domain-containing protein [Massilia sp. 9096]|uniref:choice-of-anchor J domain-containing protein n=1 Tax=Massilia sp. 9096 TaxID=1500894 RepID=UPI0012E05F73|nr:choice-of-anchor J domain-containing protein [Massilia sp. 9096]
MKGLSAKTMCAAATLSLAALGSTTARASGLEILNEGFGSVSGLNGWVQVNDSLPPGSGWLQGNPGLFSAQAGAADSYAAASFLGAANGSGTVDNWLITPTLDLYGATVLDFFSRGTGTPGFNDVLEVRFSSGASADPSSFTTLLATLGGNGNYPSSWQHDLVGVDFTGSGRFAFRYVGAADSLNYVGLDTVSVITAIPEPSHWMMLALGMGLLPLLGRAARKS